MTPNCPGPADPEREAAALDGLCAEFPGMDITASYYGIGRAWLARGEKGQPWLVMSDDLARFRAMLQSYGSC